ncbi:heme o synthase [Acuticoccus sp. MNP-M23]|uniref:heme o synthase n=1 Tax=Acuticoccus sp. MNP-M23 TaxID=3072793 RepID=UPI002815E133|nr:heme o synthase [Acuticoccus sp. MNP-M23]WMS43869.1 heme o synthase [Acuticoccus sp. MNP-M23]
MTDIAAVYEGADPIPGDFYDLLKPRVMSLVVFTALAGALLAPGTLHPLLILLSITAIAVGAGASGALNMVFDADIDAVMSRTRTRPLPSGRVSRDAALGFGILLSAGSVMVLAFASNYVAAGLLAFTIFFYVVIYTLVLKRRTPQNIVIGGAAGALPPVVGWAAVTGDVTLVPLVMFGIIFLWTPAHFWALAILKRDDYALAGVPMLPCVASATSTRRQILLYAVLTAVAGPSLTLIGAASWAYAVVASALGVWFVVRAVALLNATEDTERRNAGRLFGVSIVYLFALFGALMADHVIAMVLA